MQIFALDSVVTNTPKLFSLHGGFLTNAVHRNNLITLTHLDETIKKAHDSQIVRAKENLKLSCGGASQPRTSIRPQPFVVQLKRKP